MNSKDFNFDNHCILNKTYIKNKDLLVEEVEKLVNEEFSETKPMWKMIFYENYSCD